MTLVRGDLEGQSTTPRSVIAIGLAPDVRGRLAELARGRTLVIDYYSARCCTSVLVGDLTIRWAELRPPGGFMPLEPIEGVAVVAEPRLLDVLERAGPSLAWGGPIFARHLAVRLDEPEAWIAFLETPAAFRSHRHGPIAAARPAR